MEAGRKYYNGGVVMTDRVGRELTGDKKAVTETWYVLQHDALDW